MLEQLYKRHTDWIRMVLKLGCNKSYAEDIVQDMYIKIHEQNKKTIIQSIDIYAYFILRSLYFDYYKKKKKNIVTSIDFIDDLKDDDDFDLEDETKQSKLIDRIEGIKKELRWYDQKILNLHYSGVTMRQLSRETGISLASIYNTINNCREHIKLKLNANQKN